MDKGEVGEGERRNLWESYSEGEKQWLRSGNLEEGLVCRWAVKA